MSILARQVLGGPIGQSADGKSQIDRATGREDARPKDAEIIGVVHLSKIIGHRQFGMMPHDCNSSF